MAKRKRNEKSGESASGGGFDLDRFAAESFKTREGEVAVPELAAFFGDGARAVWRIRGLTGGEVAKVRDSVQRARDLEGLVARLAATNVKEKVGAVLEAFGLGTENEADDFVRRLTLLVIGSVDPKIERSQAVKVSEVAPLAFYRLTDQIYTLTGQGQVGESSVSGTIPESGQASPSVPGADSAAEGSGSFSN